MTWILIRYIIQSNSSNYLASTTLSLLQTKLAEKNSKLVYFMLFTLQFQIWKSVKSSVYRGALSLTPPSCPVYALVCPPLTFGEKEGARTPVPPPGMLACLFPYSPNKLSRYSISLYLSIDLPMYLSINRTFSNLPSSADSQQLKTNWDFFAVNNEHLLN